MTTTPTKEPFAKSSDKTYSLVEIVHGRTTMVDKGPDDTVFAFPIVAILELLIALGAGVGLLIFSIIKNAPLESLANPLITTDPAKAPWYFMGLQEMLEHMHPTLAGVIVPTIAILFLIAIPYLDNNRAGAGRWFTSPRGKRIVFRTTIYALVAIPAFILLDTAFSPRELLRDVLPSFLTQAVIPGSLLTLIVVLPVLFLWRFKRGTTNMREIMLVLFTMLLVSAIVLTLTGFLFRGPGFRLYLPWDMPNGYNPFNSL